MLHRYLNHVAVLAGSLGLLILGSMPASAAMTTCPSGTPTYFTVNLRTRLPIETYRLPKVSIAISVWPEK